MAFAPGSSSPVLKTLSCYSKPLAGFKGFSHNRIAMNYKLSHAPNHPRLPEALQFFLEYLPAKTHPFDSPGNNKKEEVFLWKTTILFFKTGFRGAASPA